MTDSNSTFSFEDFVDLNRALERRTVYNNKEKEDKLKMAGFEILTFIDVNGKLVRVPFTAEHAETIRQPNYGCGEEKIKKVFFNRKKRATCVLWKDGTKTIIRCHNGDRFDEEKAIALCYVKRWLFGNTGKFNDAIDKARFEAWRDS